MQLAFDLSFYLKEGEKKTFTGLATKSCALINQKPEKSYWKTQNHKF
jgi:hypothetical protein